MAAKSLPSVPADNLFASSDFRVFFFIYQGREKKLAISESESPNSTSVCAWNNLFDHFYSQGVIKNKTKHPPQTHPTYWEASHYWAQSFCWNPPLTSIWFRQTTDSVGLWSASHRGAQHPPMSAWELQGSAVTCRQEISHAPIFKERKHDGNTDTLDVEACFYGWLMLSSGVIALIRLRKSP